MPDSSSRLNALIPVAYRDLLRHRPVRLPLLASVIGRLPYGAAGLALLVLVQQASGSFASAGAVEAGFTVGVGIGLPLQGRVIDRLGQTPVLGGCALVNAAISVLLVIAAHGDAALAGLIGTALLAGLTVPPLSPCIRSLWADLLHGDEAARQTAYALDAVIIEVAFVAGPLLAAALITTVSAEAAVLTCTALGSGGALLFAATLASRAWRGSGTEARHWAGPLRSPGVLVLIAASLCFGFAIAGMEVSLIAYAKAHGSAAIAGPLISIQAVASLAGGVWFGTRRVESSLAERFVRLNLLIAISFAMPILVPPLAAMAAVMFLTGFGLAPLSATGNALAGRLAPSGTRTEAFGWMITATVLGSGAGNAVGGAIVNGGHLHLGFAAACAAMVLAWLVSAAGFRGALHRRTAEARA